MRENLNQQRVRVRFAPSPTGPLHIGGVRTALYNYLFAKQQGGDFILRIEDTDQNRYVPGAEEYIIEALEWCGIPYNEGPGKEGDCGPYRQSERREIYQQYALQLINSGHAYYAFDTTEELENYRSQYEKNGETFIYNHHNRIKLNNSLSLSEEETAQQLAAGVAYVVRFKSPENRELVLQDLVRGEIRIDTSLLDDKVLFKSDGMPTYHLANIVDDHLMRITHVIRGEEWLPSLALHELLYEALGWQAPQFAHLPLILKPEGKGKLSKRDGDKMGFPVFPLTWKDPQTGEISSGYREAGYLPQAVINMLALLGWNPGTEQEIFSLDELIQAFSLERINKSGAKFDPDKTKWFQNKFFQQVEDQELTRQLEQFLLQQNKPLPKNLPQIVSLLKERAVFTSDLYEQGQFFFEAPKQYDEKALQKIWNNETPQYLQQLIQLIQSVEEFKAPVLTDVVKGWISENQIGFGKVMQPLRLALVGEMKGPDVFDIMEILQREETVARIEKLGATLH